MSGRWFEQGLYHIALLDLVRQGVKLNQKLNYRNLSAMKISFTTASEERQDARKLRVLLQRLLANETDADNRTIVQSLLHDIDHFLAAPASETGVSVNEKESSEPDSFSPFDALFSFWHFLIGPSSREVALGKQRAELIERAEHAENSAFEALAELADLKREHTELVQKLKMLEQGLGRQDEISPPDKTA